MSAEFPSRLAMGLTTDLFAKMDQLCERQLASFYTSQDRPFSLIVYCLDYNSCKILNCCESDLDTIINVRNDRPAILKVDLSFECSQMLGGLVWMGEVVCKQARLEK